MKKETILKTHSLTFIQNSYFVDFYDSSKLLSTLI